MTESSRINERVWRVEIVFTEDDRVTRADALLDVGDRHYHGWGRAKRNPVDPDVPVIGEEIAACRALSDLAHELLDAAAATIHETEGGRVSIHQ